MPRDGYTYDQIIDDMSALKEQGIRTAEIQVMPRPVSSTFLESCLSSTLSARVSDALQRADILNETGYLREDPRKRKWVDVVRRTIVGKSNDSLVADESCVSERMNVAWAFHEFTGQFVERYLDFC